MKKSSILFLAAAAVFATACSSETTNEEGTNEEEVQAVTYTLDKDNSSLSWAANMSPEYGHTGTIMVSEGSLTMTGDEVTEGSFKVDMSSIKNTDMATEAPEKAMALEGHLKGTMVDEKHPVDLFFNTPSFPTVGVTLGEYKDGNLAITLDIVGTTLEQSVPVAIEANEEGASIKGSFGINFESTGIMGFQKNPEDGSQIGPEVKFELDLKLKK